MSELNTQQAVDGIKQDIIKSYEGRATSLTGDPVDIGNRGMTNVHIPCDDPPFDMDTIPGLDPEALAPNGVDAAADDSGCEGGACKI
ncbi:hypothetical protein HOV30_gp116 [Erwinia phage Derbicus]|uniref:Uncharacterized protein n=2 Tax=Derbicusvirus derbicus TaxID=2734104 RepID=A0A482IGT7_9CAUD|nr:hypothetical protein BIZ82_gp116 [Erwinia phage vB_EamM_EarlPhillipIV]YP_009821160.1 hypothetical protein HOV30_gp116 [Erwinia phage Derbicus]ANZ48965.1 hypothetical protein EARLPHILLIPIV_116 [Erwinia phage vB_EamM_EarlPhillipIV]QBP07542.1 hypothetical protein DERBICUS_116 [Erwinia phage Derbicus]